MSAREPRCRSCAAALEHVLVDLGVSPLANALVRPDELDRAELAVPLKVLFCDQCGLAQTSAWVAPEDIFSDYVYFSSWSSSWLEHCRAYSQQVIQRLGLGGDSFVVEIASNDGYLLQYFRQAGIPVLGIEPATNVADVARERGIPTLDIFFGQAASDTVRTQHRSADLIIANNVLAHVPDINDFVAGIANLLAAQGVATFEFPHFLNLVRDVQFDTIYH
ncbi:MAG: methyltransferase domain-containing protein, partial [Candidatus Dadabacteria bacterium]